MLVLDLDDFDQAANNLPPHRKDCLAETGMDLFSKLIEAAHYPLQLVALSSLLCRCRFCVLQSLQSLASSRHARFEFCPLEQAVLISVDQPTDAALSGADLFGELFHVDIRFELIRQSVLELLPQHVRILKHGTNVRPDGRVQPIQANGTVLTNLVAVKA